MPWILNLVYLVILLAVSPVLVYRAVVLGKYREGWRQKFLGLLPRSTGAGPIVWLHAVSVGEVLQLETVVRAMRERRDNLSFVISTTTNTGIAVAKKTFPNDRVCYFPFDFSWAVRAAIRRVRPSLIVLVELELWPNLIFAATREKIPLALINGRISEASARGYTRIRSLVRRMLDCIESLMTQNNTYADRLIALGADPLRIKVTGSIKFDRVEADRNNPQTLRLRDAFGLRTTERVFIAGSTQEPEEAIALDTWLALRNEFPALRLILVPRHKERFEQVAQLVYRRGLPLIRRSNILSPATALQIERRSRSDAANDVPPILLLDTLGELAACWGLADVAFVGGSLGSRGGQNMIEPAAYGAAVLFGPNTRNFRDVVAMLLEARAARVVRDPAELLQTARTLLADPELARQLGQRAQKLVLAQQGATARTVDALLQLLPARASTEDACAPRAA